jgi:signal peptidase I
MQIFRSLAISSIAILCLFVCGCLLQPVRHEGNSMKPAIGDGDRVLINKTPGDLKRGDIVIFYFPTDTSKSALKRIIGLPGETLEIREGKTFINGQILEEPYIDAAFNQNKNSLRPIKIPDRQYFVVGDNRDNSYDSRSWGTLPKELIYGVYYTTYSKSGK